MDIYIYNDITASTGAKLAPILNEAQEPVTIHINSAGGEVFSALAISHAIRSCKQEVQCRIEGLCASAAVLISSSCSKVTIADNSLMMIHSPFMMLMDYYNASDIEKLRATMNKIEETTAKVIKKRLKKPLDLKEERWFDAKEAVEYGLADEISGEVEVQSDEEKSLMYINKCVFKMKAPMKEDLDELKGENPTVNALIEAAKLKGARASDIKEYITAIEKTSELEALIRDQQKSGAAGVKGSIPSKPESQADMIVRIANGLI